MSLIDELEASDKKGLFRSDDQYVVYPTGFAVLDYANGFWQKTKNKNGDTEFVPVVGLMGGTFISIVGVSGNGKTSLADAIGWNIVKNFENGMMFHIDCEMTSSRPRIIQITGADYNEPRIKLVKSKASIEDVLELFDRICKMKESGGDKYKYVTDMPSYDGKSMKAYEPTVIIIDSLPAFNSSVFNVEDLGTNADQLRAAKDTTRFYTNCLGRAWEYNVTFIVINHIRPKTEMNPYAAPPRGIMMLGQNETLPRGQVAQYYSQTFFRINAKKSDMYTVEDNGMTGFKATIQLAKSKTNTVGTSFPVAFNGKMGFDPIYSLFEYASAIGIVEGKNPRLRFHGLDQYPFSRKDFRKKFLNDPEFGAGVMECLRPFLEDLLGPKPIDDEDKIDCEIISADPSDFSDIE